MPASKKLHDLIDIAVNPYADCNEEDERCILFVTPFIYADDHSEASYGASIFRSKDVAAIERLFASAKELHEDESIPYEEKDVANGIKCQIGGAHFVLACLDDNVEKLLGEDFSDSSSRSALIDRQTAEELEDAFLTSDMAVPSDDLDAGLGCDSIKFSGYERYVGTPISFRIDNYDVAAMRELLNEQPAQTLK